NYGTGELFAVAIARDRSARPAVPIALNSPLSFPDGIRWCGGSLYVAENAAGLARVDVHRGTATVIDAALNQPTSLALDEHDDLWITEGQVLTLQTGNPPLTL